MCPFSQSSGGKDRRIEHLRPSTVFMRSCQSVLCETLSPEGRKILEAALWRHQNPRAGSGLTFFFILVSSPSHRSSHGRRKSREMVYGLRVSWAEPGEVPDPEIRMVAIGVVGNARVCHCCCVSSQWLKTSSIVSDFVGRELERDLTVWFIWSLRCGLGLLSR